jgi:hypothetical protein
MDLPPKRPIRNHPQTGHTADIMHSTRLTQCRHRALVHWSKGQMVKVIGEIGSVAADERKNG